MAKLPTISGSELVRILQREGFFVVSQKGSHVSLRKENFKTVVPLHSELAKGTLLAILRQSGLTKEKLLELIKK